MKILITGATGFVGSNLAAYLMGLGHQIIATYRESSMLESCLSNKSTIEWRCVDDVGWENLILNAKPEILIHAAWAGVSFNSRNDWNVQLKNYLFSKQMFEVANKAKVSKVLVLGSQAEYGVQNKPSNEEMCTRPKDAYGSFKVLTSNLLRDMFVESEVEWYWMRLYSVFGGFDNSNTLLSVVIDKLLQGSSIELTPCEQRYNYIYVDALMPEINSVLVNKTNHSGIYNLCASESIILKDMLYRVASLMGKSSKFLRFGDLIYRNNQPMVVDGNVSKFIDVFKNHKKISPNIESGLLKTIQDRKKRTK